MNIYKVGLKSNQINFMAKRIKKIPEVRIPSPDDLINAKKAAMRPKVIERLNVVLGNNKLTLEGCTIQNFAGVNDQNEIPIAQAIINEELNPKGWQAKVTRSKTVGIVNAGSEIYFPLDLEIKPLKKPCKC